MDNRILTKQAKWQTTIRLPKPDVEIIIEAARIAGRADLSSCEQRLLRELSG
jgi:hypothetical protein